MGQQKTATELTSQELEALQYMKKCGKLDMVNVQKQADMIKRNEYLSMNPWKISEPKSDKFWRGYIPDKSKPNRQTTDQENNPKRSWRCNHWLLEKGIWSHLFFRCISGMERYSGIDWRIWKHFTQIQKWLQAFLFWHRLWKNGYSRYYKPNNFCIHDIKQ